jgi:hypothetical protein
MSMPLLPTTPLRILRRIEPSRALCVHKGEPALRYVNAQNTSQDGVLAIWAKRPRTHAPTVVALNKAARP